MQTGCKCDCEELVPGRMEFDLVEAMTVTIERAQLRSEFIGVETKPDGFRLAERRA